MSKWIKKDLFTKFRTELAEDQEKRDSRKTTGEGSRVWQKLEKGTVDKPITYEGRFLPDKDGSPSYKKMYYHMFKRGDSWIHVLCEKTFGFDNFCGYCHASKALWTGSDADKKAAKAYNRKEKYASNFYVSNDPRDADVPQDIENRELKLNSKKVKIFEFGIKLESKVRQELLDEKNGAGYAIFDPGDGYDFIIKVKSTKQDANGNVWPDYADSKFSRGSSSLGTDKEIKAIMDSCADLNEYLKSMRKTPAEMKKMLEQDMLWGLVRGEWERVYGVEDKEEAKAAAKEEGIRVVESVDSDDDVPVEAVVAPDETDGDLSEALKNL